MRLVLDTNIVISSLISPDGVVGSILLNRNKDIENLTCNFLYVEVFDKKDKMLKLSKLSEADFLQLLYFVIKEIDFINEKQIQPQTWEIARKLVENIDDKDIAFVALAIETKAILWTGDKKLYNGLKNKGFDHVISTQELIELLKK